MYFKPGGKKTAHAAALLASAPLACQIFGSCVHVLLTDTRGARTFSSQPGRRVAHSLASVSTPSTRRDGACSTPPSQAARARRRRRLRRAAPHRAPEGRLRSRLLAPPPGAALREGVKSIYLDLEDDDAVATTLHETLPDVVVNCAAISSPAKCEQTRCLAMSVELPPELPSRPYEPACLMYY